MTQINGQSFPDHVLALTWDDGPDASTLALAEYLRRQKVSATFFVVGDWAEGISSDPGEGRGVYQTGHERIPILGDLVRLGHRLGNHTLHHVLLSEVSAPRAAFELRENQERLDLFLTSEVRLFRAPGGAWSSAAAEAVADDPYLSRLTGPVRWDVDRKDWDGSLSCAGNTATDCQRSTLPSRMEVKPSVMADRYLESIEETGRGIVLLHDRVGHVGSTYALDVARSLVPRLRARGYVFAAPVLAFSPLLLRSALGSRGTEGAIGIADIDGDGRADLCSRDESGVVCESSIEIAGDTADGMPHAGFGEAVRWGGEWATNARELQLADVDGDGRADLCGLAGDALVCARATEARGFAAPKTWSSPFGTVTALTFGDIDGDGKADICGRGPAGILCARSEGDAFEAPRPWLGAMESMALADVDGDGRADLCGRQANGLVCALARGRGDRATFAEAARWSDGRDFEGGPIAFGDLNGDGRSDACGRGPGGIVCALSTGRAFTRAATWAGGARGAGVLLADVNGDGRADACLYSTPGVVCGLAP